MKTGSLLAFAAALLLAGVSALSAAGTSSSSAPSSSAGIKMAPPASGTLNLTASQQKEAWNDLYVKSLNQKAPEGFKATPGAAVPDSVTTAPVTQRAASEVPALKHYSFAMLQKKLLIVNPTDRKIAEVITR